MLHVLLYNPSFIRESSLQLKIEESIPTIQLKNGVE